MIQKLPLHCWCSLPFEHVFSMDALHWLKESKSMYNVIKDLNFNFWTFHSSNNLTKSSNRKHLFEIVKYTVFLAEINVMVSMRLFFKNYNFTANTKQCR